MKKTFLIVVTSILLFKSSVAMESAVLSQNRPLVKHAKQLESWYRPAMFVTNETGETYQEPYFQRLPDTPEGNLFAAVLVDDEDAVARFLGIPEIDVNWQVTCFDINWDDTERQAVADSTALLQALRLSHLRIFSKILAHPRTNVNIADHNKITPLILAVECKSPLAFYPILDHQSFDFWAYDQGNRALTRAQELNCEGFISALKTKQAEVTRHVE